MELQKEVVCCKRLESTLDKHWADHRNSTFRLASLLAVLMKSLATHSYPIMDKTNISWLLPQWRAEMRREEHSFCIQSYTSMRKEKTHPVFEWYC